MTYTTTICNCVAINSNQGLLITMPLRFTSLEANFFQQELQTIYKNSFGYQKIILDFSQTSFIDSNGLIALCRIVREARNSTVNLVFSSFSPQVQMVLSLARLDEVFKVEDKIEVSD